MANSDNRGDHGSYEGNSSLPVAFGLAGLPVDPIMGDVNILEPDPAPKANTPAPTSAPDQTVGPAVLNPLFYEQLHQFIMETINLTLLPTEKWRNTSKSRYGRASSCQASAGSIHSH
ncbi:UNVERIFIED_CONTAM: hypothetical protein Slati_2906600 [Sesamum latifolium]|uniref:Uncharacterized protein n=1 Tax=Sesamum latifolium TaxID=2727402 RepID=A0AAW2VDN0_9LAMI